jgi:hypothetical protein
VDQFLEGETVIALLLILALCAPTLTYADTPAFIPNLKPGLMVTRLDGVIEIDGDIGDAGWATAARATNFTETFPGDQVRPPVDTEVLITYDDEHLYVAFIVHDDPGAIRASMRARDEIFNDDFVGIILDTYDNQAWAYELFVNPLGIQGDLRWTDDGEDVGFDLVWESQGRITADGWQAEIAVPFKSLRFPDGGSQEWRVNFWRTHPRDSRRSYTWASISRDDPCYLCQFGTMRGLEGVKPGGSIEALPSIVGSQFGELNDEDDPDSGFDNKDPDVEASIGLRYSFTSSVAAELTVNPDFSQVESDVEKIDVNTTFALFFPERRPFFQEGSDLFASAFDVVHTRQINDPTFAGKLTGRTDETSFIYLVAHDENTPLLIPEEERTLLAAPGRSVSNIARATRSLGEDNFAGAVLTDRRYEGGGSSTVGGLDAEYRFLQNYTFEVQALVSYTEEPDQPDLIEGVEGDTFDRGKYTVALDGETFGGHGAHVSFEREARHWQSDIEYWDVSPKFRADNGFVFRNSERRFAWDNEYVFYTENDFLDQVTPEVLVWRRWNSFSQRKGSAIENTLEFRFKGQTSVELGYDRMEERFRGRYFDGIDLYYGEFNTAFSEMLQFGFWFGAGDRIARTADPAPYLGEGSSLDVWGTFKPLRRLVIEPLFNYELLREPETNDIFFEGFVWRVKSNYQFTRELFLRLVLQYDDFEGELNIEPLLTYELNPFTVFYVGASINELDFDHESRRPNADNDFTDMRTGDGFEPTSWQVFFKFQYFFRT